MPGGSKRFHAPVIGSRPQADAAQLIFMVGGDVNALSRAEPLLKTMGSAVYHVGPTGSGSNASMPLLDATRAVMEVAVRKGLGNDNITGIARLYR